MSQTISQSKVFKTLVSNVIVISRGNLRHLMATRMCAAVPAPIARGILSPPLASSTRKCISRHLWPIHFRAQSTRSSLRCLASKDGAKPATNQPSAGRGPRAAGGPRKPKPQRIELDESDPIFQPALVRGDPPGHRSGYLAIVGRPNAGKSTLMNCLLGQKLSIVTAKAQTTRHKILGILSGEDHQVVMLDTPGVINRAGSGMERRMIQAVKNAIQDADAVLAIIDASDRPEDALAMLAPGDTWTGPPLCMVINKADIVPAEEIARIVDTVKNKSGAMTVLPISAKVPNQSHAKKRDESTYSHRVPWEYAFCNGLPTHGPPPAAPTSQTGAGTEELKKWMIGAMPEGPTLYHKDYVAQASERFFGTRLSQSRSGISRVDAVGNRGTGSRVDRYRS